MSLAEQVFASVLRELIRNIFTEFVKMSNTEKEWKQEAIGFIENYGFPCIGASNGFHVYVSPKLKNFYSFKEVFDFKHGSHPVDILML